MDRPSVYVTQPEISKGAIKDLLRFEFDVMKWEESYPIPREKLLSNVKGKAVILCTSYDKIDTEILDAAGPNLKMIGTVSVGCDHIDVEACKKRGVQIGYSHKEITNSIMSITLLAIPYLVDKGVKDSTIGIVGFDLIGQEAAKSIIHMFEPQQILYYSRSEKVGLANNKTNVSRVDFNSLLERSDIVICTIESNPETEKMFNAEAFLRMKLGAVVINAAAENLVDWEALCDVLQNKRINFLEVNIANVTARIILEAFSRLPPS